MTFQDWSEPDIQSLKAQEAKDLAIQFLHALQSKEQGPISPGEVQLRELDYELKLKQAEIEDANRQREHERQIRELELKLEQQRSQAAEAHSHADAVRQELKDLVERVRSSEESLSVSLERATREHRLQLERLEKEYADRRSVLESEIQDLTSRRDELAEQLQQLSDIQVNVEALAQTNEQITSKQSTLAQQQQQLDDEIATLEFNRTKRVNEVKQTQELDLARLKHEHQKQVLSLERQAAEEILAGLNLVAIEQPRLEDLNAQLAESRSRLEQGLQIEEDKIRERVRREYNITSEEPVDVTALHYRQQASSEQVTRLDKRIGQLEQELAAARQHIQGEPQRIATAVEAARTPIHNIVEPASKR